MTRSLWIAVSLVLALIITLSFVRPHQMVSPGDVIPAHSAIQNDCFACHTPFLGASAERCTSCHVVAEIGLLTTEGEEIPSSEERTPFHQALAEPDCMACHSDHARPQLAETNTTRFDHALLNADSRDDCQSCHMPPRDELHRGEGSRCATCHQTTRWKPATFAHDRYFLLDRNHIADCTTCHVGGNYQRYTCYGCHEHQPAQIIAEHREKGISNIENCVRCHRSADEESGEGGEREGNDD